MWIIWIPKEEFGKYRKQSADAVAENVTSNL